jgi:Bacterial dnaA protein helix-turn-helix
MASAAFGPSIPYRRLSLARIDSLVSARLGPTRIQGNTQPACFNRQVAMYLAKHIAGWRTTMIGRFYHVRDHSTVVHGIQRIEALRESDPAVDTLLSELKGQLEQATQDSHETCTGPAKAGYGCCLEINELADAIAERVWARLSQRLAVNSCHDGLNE